MDSIKVKTSAKINLSLDVVGRKPDGYHLIESIFQSVNIYDIITVSKTENGIHLTCNEPEIPCDSRNIAYKAARLFLDKTGIKSGINIHIEKHIPSQAGLGGGSSDGAGVLYAMNTLFDTNIDICDLAKLGANISADTAFFIYGGTAFVQGIGEIINPIRLLPPIELVIAKGRSGISTPEAYKMIDELSEPNHIDTHKLLKAIDKGKFMYHCNCCGNIFEQVTSIIDVFDIKKRMLANGAENAVMSGSGSAVFGIFKDFEAAAKCSEKLKNIYPFAVHCQTIPQSITTETN